MAHQKRRCDWATGGDALTESYHDKEWGVPVHDDRHLFELLTLEGAQAGLSWSTILHKRENYRKAFGAFDPEGVASYGPAKVKSLLSDPGIVRNRLKVNSTIQNAKALLVVRDGFGTFDSYLWWFVGGKPKVNKWRTMGELPASTSESEAMSKDLLKRGFRFAGPTICYAFMQATGMVNDHVKSCFRYRELV